MRNFIVTCNHAKKWINRFVNYGIRHYGKTKGMTKGDEISIPQEYLEYFSSYKSKGNFLRILHPTTAEKFAQLIMSAPVDNAAYTMEINPSPGLLTEKLMDAGMPTINLFEDMTSANSYLQPIAEKYPNRVHPKGVSFFYMWHLIMNDWLHNTNCLAEFLGGIEKRNWNDDPVFHIIGATSSFQILSQLISRVVFQNGLASYGRIALHLALPVSLWNKLSSKNESYKFYNASTVMYQILFQHQLLGTLPRKAFHPHFVKISTDDYSWKRHLVHDQDTLCVVRIEAKKELFDEIISRQEIPALYYFIKHHMKRRTNKIIPEFEKWIPGSGRQLIKKGYTIHNEFGELLPHELVTLFKVFKSLPGYDSSSFVTMVDQFPQNMDENIVFGENPSETIDQMFKISREMINSEASSPVSQNPETNSSIPTNHL